jgi:hypothetical protein
MFIASRVFIDARYMLRDPQKDHYLIMFSSIGNELIVKDYQHDFNGAVLARAIISGHWYKPLYDEATKKVIGT